MLASYDCIIWPGWAGDEGQIVDSVRGTKIFTNIQDAWDMYCTDHAGESPIFPSMFAVCDPFESGTDIGGLEIGSGGHGTADGIDVASPTGSYTYGFAAIPTIDNMLINCECEVDLTNMHVASIVYGPTDSFVPFILTNCVIDSFQPLNGSSSVEFMVAAHCYFGSPFTDQFIDGHGGIAGGRVYSACFFVGTPTFTNVAFTDMCWYTVSVFGELARCPRHRIPRARQIGCPRDRA